jgi:type II secretory pathway pseudopilin PulG
MTRRRDRGFFMFELPVVILMIGIGLMVLAALLFQFARSVRADFEERAAREAAHAVAELLDARGAGGLADGAQPADVPLPSWKHLRGGRCTVTRTPVDGRGWTVEVAVEWTDFNQRDRRVAVATYIDRRSP